MNAWQFFANLYTTLVTPAMQQLQAMLGDVCAAAQPIALGLIGLWLVLSFWELGNGTKALPQILKEGFIAGMALTALQAGQYTPWISNLALQAIPNSIGAALGAPGSPVAGLDKVLASTLKAALKTYDALPSYSFKSIPLACAIIVFVATSAISICYAFGVYMVAAIINIVTVVVGPIFLALAAIPQTRRFAAGWLAVLAGGCTTQLMALTVITLLNGAEAIMIQQVVVTAADSDSNSIAMLWGLAQVGMLLWLSKLVIMEIPSIARAMGGGVYHGASSIGAMTYGVAAMAGGAAVGAARAGAAAVGSHAARQVGGGAVRSSAPAGASISGGRA